jgi:ABC-2 type transport system permease protein
MMKSANKKRDITALLLGVAIVILLNVVGSFLFHRFDLTSEKRYTLAPATKKLLGELKDVVFVKVYLEGEFPAGFKKLRDETREMLDEFRAYSNNNIEYEFIDPTEGVDKKQQDEIFRQLYNQGLQPFNLEVKEEAGSSQQILWPGAIVSYRGKQMPWQLLQTQMALSAEAQLNNSVQSLEYQFASCIRNLSTPVKPMIGFIEGHGELDTLRVKDLSESLGEFYALKRVNINGQLEALSGLRAIIIAKPDTSFSERDKFIIDQFVMGGGKVLWAIDPLETSVDSLVRKGQAIATPYETGLDNLLFRYGARINPNMVIDIQCSGIPVNVALKGQQPRFELKPWIFFPLIMPSGDHVITKNLDVVRMEYTGSIDTLVAKGVKKSVLLKSSKYSKTLMAPVRVDMGYLRGTPDEKQFRDSYQPVAVLLEGTFESAYRNHPAKEKLRAGGLPVLDASKKTAMIVVADGDLLRNDIQFSTRKPYPLGFDKYTNQTYGNKNFLLNCINYLCDDSGLISVRSRELTLRLLDKKKVKTERVKYQVMNTCIPLALVIVFGLIYHFRRKHKYAK